MCEGKGFHLRFATAFFEAFEGLALVFAARDAIDCVAFWAVAEAACAADLAVLIAVLTAVCVMALAMFFVVSIAVFLLASFIASEAI